MATDGDASSDDSRVTLGTLGHHHEWAGTDPQELAFDDADPGTEHWRATPTHSIRSSPTVVDDSVYVGTDDGDLVARDATTGSEQWSFETNGEIRAAPTVAGETVCIGHRGGTVRAVDVSTGDQRWSFETEAPDRGIVTDRRRWNALRWQPEIRGS